MSFKKVGIAGTMPGTGAWSVGCFPSGEVPVGTELFIKEGSPIKRHNDSAAVAAIKFSLRNDIDEGDSFLRCWNEGDFDSCRKWWPEAPEDCYIGADPLHSETKKLMNGPTIKELLGCIGVNQETNTISGAHDIKAFADCVLKHWGNQ